MKFLRLKKAEVQQPNKPKPTTTLPDNMEWSWDPNAADWVAVMKNNTNVTPPLYNPQNQNMTNNNATTYMSTVKSSENFDEENLNNIWIVDMWLDNMDSEDGHDTIEFTKIGLIDWLNSEIESYCSTDDVEPEPIPENATNEQLKQELSDWFEAKVVDIQPPYNKRNATNKSLSVLPRLLDKVWYDYEEETAGKYAQIDSWEIGLGGYDSGYEVSYKGTPIFSITEDNELKPYMSDDRLQKDFGFSYSDVEKALRKHRDMTTLKRIQCKKQASKKYAGEEIDKINLDYMKDTGDTSYALKLLRDGIVTRESRHFDQLVENILNDGEGTAGPLVLLELGVLNENDRYYHNAIKQCLPHSTYAADLLERGIITKDSEYYIDAVNSAIRSYDIAKELIEKGIIDEQYVKNENNSRIEKLRSALSEAILTLRESGERFYDLRLVWQDKESPEQYLKQALDEAANRLDKVGMKEDADYYRGVLKQASKKVKSSDAEYKTEEVMNYFKDKNTKVFNWFNEDNGSVIKNGDNVYIETHSFVNVPNYIYNAVQKWAFSNGYSFYTKTASKKVKSDKEKTIQEYEEMGLDITDLLQACQYVHYGFYDEIKKKWSPEKLYKYLQDRLQKAQDNPQTAKFEKNWTSTRFPEALKLISHWFDTNVETTWKDLDSQIGRNTKSSCLAKFLDGPRYSKEIKIEAGLIKNGLVKYAGFDFNRGTKYAITEKGLKVLRSAAEKEHNEALNEREKLAYMFGFNTDKETTLDTTGKTIKADDKDIIVIDTGSGYLQVFENKDTYTYGGHNVGEQLYQFDIDDESKHNGIAVLNVDDMISKDFYTITFENFDDLEEFVWKLKEATTQKEIVSLLNSKPKKVDGSKTFTITEADGTPLGKVTASSELDAKVKFGIEHPEYAESLSISAKEIKADDLYSPNHKDPKLGITIGEEERLIKQVAKDYEISEEMSEFIFGGLRGFSKDWKLNEQHIEIIAKNTYLRPIDIELIAKDFGFKVDENKKVESQYEQTTNTKEPYPNPSETPHDDVILENHDGWVNTANKKSK